ncbi:MAG TPA: thiamine phosphate synthase [Nitrososphaerales archaeon]|nr:thiamine phosphate synthase [Nitrososphaerales archaeon]
MKSKKRIKKGVYLVVDPSYGEERVLSVTEASMRGGLDVLQLWASWKDDKKAIDLGLRLKEIAERYSVPFLINNDLEVALKIGADGVHLDGTEPVPSRIREKMGSDSIVGVTCSTNMEKVLWAEKSGADYISFCSMYPSSSVNECDIVPLGMVREARRSVSLPIFASGGINLLNAHEVLGAGADGIAVISTIMGAKDPGGVTRQLKEIVRTHELEETQASL